jgi:hypothetical protein
MTWNQSAFDEYNQNLNINANARDYLIPFTKKLAISTANSIKLQASLLAQMTEATNQLTRNTLVRFQALHSPLLNVFVLEHCLG